jgi:hypothetical protein
MSTCLFCGHDVALVDKAGNVLGPTKATLTEGDRGPSVLSA